LKKALITEENLVDNFVFLKKALITEENLVDNFFGGESAYHGRKPCKRKKN
jgi:hypothetical protein